MKLFDRFGTFALTTLLTAGLLAGMGAVGSPFIGDAQAQKEERDERDNRNTRRVHTPSPKIANTLVEAQDALQAEDYVTAQAALNSIKNKEKLPDFDRAIIAQMTAFIFAGQERYREAAAKFEEMIRLGKDTMQPQQLLDAIYYVGQLYISFEEYEKGISYLKRWFDQTENPGPPAYVLMGQAYAAKNDYRNALIWVEKGVNLSIERGQQPREPWLQLARGLYYEADRIKDSTRVLEMLVDWYPKKEYWVQLSALYGMQEKEKDQLATLEAAYRQDLLTKSAEYEELAQRYMVSEMPWWAVKVLEKGFKNKFLEQKQDNWELMGKAYHASQEVDKALPWYQKAAKASNSADLYMLMGQVYMQKQDWRMAASSFNNALRKNVKAPARKKIRDVGNTYMMLGVAHYYAGSFAPARKAFTEASKFSKHRKDADNWQNFVNQAEKEKAAGAAGAE